LVISMPTAKRAKPKLAVRSVTILGATGSIGSSTVDLLKRQPERFSVEALTAHKNGVALAQLARELGARFAAVADPSAYNELEVRVVGYGHRGRGREPMRWWKPRAVRPIG
jgi:1-deoxy-D-xylulose-5-phosphate reductoisomerase